MAHNVRRFGILVAALLPLVAIAFFIAPHLKQAESATYSTPFWPTTTVRTA